MRCAFVASAAGVLFAVAAAPAFAAAAPDGPRTPVRDVITFAELGYASDRRVDGTRPQFALSVPVTPRLTAAVLRLATRFGPAVDGHSVVAISIDGTLLARRSVAALISQPTLSVQLPVTRGAPKIDVEIDGELASTGNTCVDVRERGLWMSLRNTSSLELTSQPPGAQPFVAQFMDPFANSISVVLPHNVADDIVAEALPLAYRLHQIDRWAQRRVSLREAPAADHQALVVDSAIADSAVRGLQLRLSPAALHRAMHDVNALFPDTAAAPLQEKARLSVADLGMQPRSGRGLGSFAMFGRFDEAIGEASDADLHLEITHSRIFPNDRAFVSVYINGALQRTYRLGEEPTHDVFDVAIAHRDVRARNSLAIVATYMPEGAAACVSARQSFRLTVDEATTLVRTNFRRGPLGIGDFLSAARQRLIVLTADPSLLPAAFSVLDVLGRGAPDVTRLDVRDGDWHVPAGYDAAIVVLPPELLARSLARFHHDDIRATLTGIASEAQIFRIAHEKSFVSLQTTTVHGIPTLFVSYTGAAGIIGPAMETWGATLTQERGDLAIFTADGILFRKLDTLDQNPESYAEHVRHAALPVIATFSLAIGLLVTIASRRTVPRA